MAAKPQEIAAALKISVDELNKQYMSVFPVRAEKFKLQQRALHVFEEAARVLDFIKLLEDPTQHLSGTDTTSLNQALGGLMNETQDSCRNKVLSGTWCRTARVMVCVPSSC